MHFFLFRFYSHSNIIIVIVICIVANQKRIFFKHFFTHSQDNSFKHSNINIESSTPHFQSSTYVCNGKVYKNEYFSPSDFTNFFIFQTSVQHQETEQPVNFFTLIHFVVLLFFLDKELEVVGFDDDMIAAASS